MRYARKPATANRTSVAALSFGWAAMLVLSATSAVAGRDHKDGDQPRSDQRSSVAAPLNGMNGEAAGSRPPVHAPSMHAPRSPAHHSNVDVDTQKTQKRPVRVRVPYFSRDIGW